MIIQTAWNLLAAHLNAPDLANVGQFWPLLLVGLGLAILLALKPANRSAARRGPREGE
jgi:hypothetical protein